MNKKTLPVKREQQEGIIKAAKKSKKKSIKKNGLKYNFTTDKTRH